MNQQASNIGAIEVLKAWQSSVGTGKRLSALEVQSALKSKRAQIDAVEKKVKYGNRHVIERHLTVTYGDKVMRADFADSSCQTLRPPQGLLMYNALNHMIAFV
ncbi:MAG: hypothetical protein AAF988_06460 [Pseudomonadota bacterium]